MDLWIPSKPFSPAGAYAFFTEQPVPAELIEKLLRAAMQAPSAGNQQAWQFLAITDRAQLNALADVLPYGKMLTTAPLGLVVCGDLDREKSKGYWVQDCSTATQNILLAAHAQGLGAVWLGVYPREQRVEAVRKRWASRKAPSPCAPLQSVILQSRRTACRPVRSGAG